MNGKERIAAALDGRPTDRVPYAEYGIDSTVIEKILGHPTYLRNHIGLTFAFWENRHDEVMQSWIADHIELHRKLDVLDIVLFGWGVWELPPETDDLPPRRIDAKTWEDKYGWMYLLSEETGQIHCVRDPTIRDRRAPTVEDFQANPEPPVRNERSWRVPHSFVSVIHKSGGFRKKRFLLRR